MSKTTPISQWRPWNVFTFLTTTLGLGVIAAWVWLNQSLSWLPNPDSREGKNLLYDYNIISHGLVFALLGLAAVATSSGLIALEELQSKSFLYRVSDIKIKQDSWLQTINEIEKVIRDKPKMVSQLI